MEKKTKAWQRWLYWFSIATAVVIVYKTLDSIGAITGAIGNFLSILTPFFIGILIAYILYVPCKKLEKLLRKSKKIKITPKLARAISVIIVYIIAIAIIVILFTWIIPPVVNSVIDLVSNFQSYYDMAVEKISEIPEDSFVKTEIINKVVEAVGSIDIKQIINVDNFSQYAQGAIGVANGFVSFIINLFVAIIVSVYILITRSSILNFLKKLAAAIFGQKVFQNLDKYFNRSNEIFFNFLSSQLIDAVVVGILTSVGMSIIGVKYSVLLGFMIGLFNIIPYVGAIIAVIIAALITLLTGGIQQAIIMLIVVIILQQIDANIINPRIIGSSLKINPILVMLAITVGGAYFGMLGIFLSVPIVAIIKILLDDFIIYRNKQMELKQKNQVKQENQLKQE